MPSTCYEFGHRWGADVARNCWRCVYCSAVVDGPTLDLNDPTVSYGKRPDQPACGLCGRTKPLAPGRTICADCAHFPLD